jgi:hypothetical protein
MITRITGKQNMTWRELSEALSKLNILSPDTDISEITLTKPKTLLLHTVTIIERQEKQKE